MADMFEAGVMAVPSSNCLGREADLLLCSCSNDGTLLLHAIDRPLSSQAASGGGNALASRNLSKQESNAASLAAVRLPADVFSSPVYFDGFVFLGCRDNYLHCLALS